MIYKTFSYWMWFAIFGILALGLATKPLFNILAFEFCAIITLCVAFACSHVAMTEFQTMKRDPDNLIGSASQVIFGCFWRAFLANIVVLIAALTIILLNAFRIKNCNFGEGFLFFLLLPTLSCMTATAAGLFFNVWIQKRWLAYLAYLAFLLISCVPVAVNLIFHPPVFAFHPIFGYFPGPIYDFVISITSTLLIARGETLIWALLFLTISIYACEIGRETSFVPKLRWRNLIQFSAKNSLWRIITVCILIVALISLEFFSGKLRIRPTRGDIAQALGGYKETEHFEIFYARELEDEIDLFADDCEFRYVQLSEYLQTTISRKVRAYLYASPEQKKRLIGAGSTYVEDPFGYGFHIHSASFPHPVLKHELAHVLTADWSPWKVSLNVGVHEGIAVAADWDEGQLTVHQWAKAMRQLKVAPRLSSVMGIGFWSHASSRSYLLAGSFIRFLVDTYGLEKLKQAFPFGNLSKSYTKDLSVLEAEWIKFLSNEVPLQGTDLAYAERSLKRGGIFEQVCAHEMASLRSKAWEAYYRNDFRFATNTFQQMLSDEPENSRTLLELMYSAFKMGDYKLTTSLAKRMIADVNSQYRSEAARLLGDIYWLQEDAEKALNQYKEAVLFATRETVEQRLLKRIAALSENYTPQSRERLRTVILPKSSAGRMGSGTKMALLLQVIETEPDEWLAYFLAGELLHKERTWELSTQYLHHTIALGKEKDKQTMPPQIALKSRWLLGLNAFHMTDYRIAEEIFSSVATDQTQPMGTQLSARYWIERCQWIKSRTRDKQNH
ncbi:MAG: hypothetical protein OXI43_05100 [Candidatus Poribacteria bacterium]|nr:hypothetical protein [Candidatus Poribacteria bacterium]